jgi:DNA-binding response OmpR family regulator
MSRILVIDDDRSVRHLIGKVFEDSDVEVLAGATADEGLQLLIASPPDAVLFHGPGPRGSMLGRLNSRSPRIVRYPWPVLDSAARQGC